MNSKTWYGKIQHKMLELLFDIFILSIVFALSLYIPFYVQQWRARNRIEKSDETRLREMGSFISEREKSSIRRDYEMKMFCSDEQTLLIETIQKKVREINRNLSRNQHIDEAEKQSAYNQIDKIEDKTHVLIEQLVRVERAKRLVGNGEKRTELGIAAEAIEADVHSVSDALDHLLATVLDLEVDGSRLKVQRLIHDLTEHSQRIRELSDSVNDEYGTLNLHHGP